MVEVLKNHATRYSPNLKFLLLLLFEGRLFDSLGAGAVTLLPMCITLC